MKLVPIEVMSDATSAMKPCKENAMTTLCTCDLSTPPRATSPRFMQAIGIIIDAFREALDMRRAAHAIRPIYEE
jgi:hypothetical protein